MAMLFAVLAVLALFVVIIVLPIYAAIRASEAIQITRQFKDITNHHTARLQRVEAIVLSANAGSTAQSVDEPIKKTMTSQPVPAAPVLGSETKFEDRRADSITNDTPEIQFLDKEIPDSVHAKKPDDTKPKKGPLPQDDVSIPNVTPASVDPSSKEETEVTLAPAATVAEPSPAPQPQTVASMATENPYEHEVIFQDEQKSPASVATESNLPADSFELRLGTYWFVRIGVLLLLSGLAFLAYAKRQFFYDLSPEARVTGFYLFSIALAGTGWWIQRVNEQFKNYGQVLMAGGFAGIYFTTYAAHVIDPILVFPNQTMVIGMLLFWGACLFVYSNWVKSETIAVFATGASYFATYLPLIHTNTTDPWVILASNVILASTSVFFFLKNRWFKISAVSMLASYGGMSFCIARLGMEQATMLMVSVSILWALYTLATFISNNKQFNDISRSVFATVNNFFATLLLTYTVWQTGILTIWQIELLGGLSLLGCAIALPRFQKSLHICRNTYLTQGMILANFGFVAMNLNGSMLGPIIATQALVLLVMTTFKRDQFVEGLCILMSIVAIAFNIFDLISDRPFAFAASMVVASILMIAGYLYSRTEENEAIGFRARVSTYTLLSISIYTLGVLFQADVVGLSTWMPCLLIAAPITFLATHRAHRVIEFTVFWSLLTVLGIAWGAFQMLQVSWGAPTLVLTLAAIVQMHLWKFVNQIISEQGDKFRTRLQNIGEFVSAGGVTLLVFTGVISIGLTLNELTWVVDRETIIWMGPLLAISSVTLLVYGKLFGMFWLAAMSQVLLVFSSLEMIRTTCLVPEQNQIWLSLICVASPLIHLLVVKIPIRQFTHPLFTAERKREFIVAQGTLMAVVSSAWVYCYVPAAFHVTWLMMLAIGLCVFVEKFDKGRVQWQASIAAVLAVFLYGIQLLQQELSFASLTSLLGVMLVQQVARQYPNTIEIPKQVHQAIVTTCSILLFLSVTVPSNQIHLEKYFHSLTLVWTCLGAGFLLLGLFRRERIYRLMGLIVWGLALASLLPAFLGMSTEMKIASTFALGSVFILFGYFYTKYKDQIRELI